MMKPIMFLLVLAILSVQGCQHQSTEEPVVDKIATKPLVKDCGPSGMPPIRDRSKLIDNLRAKGVITDGMDQVQIDKTVADYITKRQQAFKKCPKPTPNTGKS